MGNRDAFVTKIDSSVSNGEPTIGCRGVVQATGTPVLREASRGSILSAFGRDFMPEGMQALAPELDANGRVSTNLANTCVEVDGVRAPIFAALPGQINFQNPHQTELGYASYRVIRACGTPQEQASEPERIMVSSVTPAFFNFVNNADGFNPIAALHQDGVSLVGLPGLFGDAAETTPAAPGEFVSLFAGGFGATDPPFEAGVIPGVAAGLATSDFQVTIGGIAVPPEDIAYIGVAPCCAGLYQLVMRIPPQTSTGRQGVVVTIQGRSSSPGPYLTVQAQ